MQVKKVFFGALIVTIAFSAYGMSKLTPFKQKSVKERMESISQTIRDLTPYTVSEKDFTDEKNTKLIKDKLSTLTTEFETLQHNPAISNLGLTLNQTVMLEELRQTKNLFDADKKSLARSKFTALLNLCISCHVQVDSQMNVDKLKITVPNENLEKLPLTDFEKAEMYFISRNYQKAIDLYDRIVLSTKKTDDDEFVYQSLGRQLLYFVTIKKDFPGAKAHFKRYLDKKNLNQALSVEVKDWVNLLSKKSLWDNFDPQKVTEDQMKKFMSTFINDEDEGPFFTVDSSTEVLDLNLSQILRDYYNAHPDTKLGGQILYWLGIVDRRLNNELFFSLGDYYLLSCMEKYPTEKIAQDCYDSYVQELEVNYLTKENQKFPTDVEARLNRLKALINYKEPE